MDNAKQRSNINALDWSKMLEDAGVGELMVTSIDREGRMKGFDNELISRIVSNAKIPVIASGGAGKAEDISSLQLKTKCEAAAIASLFHYQKMTVSEAKDFLLSKSILVRK